MKQREYGPDHVAAASPLTSSDRRRAWGGPVRHNGPVVSAAPAHAGGGIKDNVPGAAVIPAGSPASAAAQWCSVAGLPPLAS